VSQTLTWSSYTSLKASAGMVFHAAPWISFGLMADYVFNPDESGEFCDEDDNCSDNEIVDIIDFLHVYGLLKLSF
jgi:hypothetical protein